jgi:hypothetical protein
MPASRRHTSIAGGLALALALAAGPSASAQDAAPEQVVNDLLAAVEAKDFSNLGGFFCAEFADQASSLDLSSITASLPEGMDVNTLLDAVTLDAELSSLEVISQTETEAVVHAVGTLVTGIDGTKLAPLVEALLGTSGQEVTEDMVTMMTDMLASELSSASETITIDEEITVVPGDAGGWVICDSLMDATASPMPAASAAAVEPAASPVASAAAG